MTRKHKLKTVGLVALVIMGALVGTLVAVPLSDTNSGIVAAQGETTVDHFYSVDGGGNIHKSHVENGSSIWETSTSAGSFYSVATVPQDDVVYAGDGDGNLRQIDTETGVVNWERNIFPGGDTIRSIVTADGETFFIVRSGGLIRYNVEEDNILWHNTEPFFSRADTALDIERERLYVGGDSETVRRFDTETGDLTHNYSTFDGSRTRGVDISPDGTMIYGAEFDRQFAAVFSETDSLFWRTSSTSHTTTALALTPDNSTVVGGESDGEIHGLDATNGNELWVGDNFDEALQIAATDEFAIVGSTDGRVGRFNISDGDKTWHLNSKHGSARVEGVALPNAKHFIEQTGELDLQVRSFIPVNTSVPYTVYHNDGENWTDVTENATITIENTSFIEWNSTSLELETQLLNGSTNVTAEFEGFTDTETVNVADVSIANIDLLPFWRSVQATFTDSSIQALFIIIVLGSLMGRLLKNPYVAFAIISLLALGGWMIDFIGTGLMLATIITTIFAGLMAQRNTDRF